ncbi:hypothetical protein VOLCADRAFT_121683 [Volvox carteri f. nagariensis]|uniref:Uncharacterized protein n=1 Tax=Volvox carteri f. nagariensis TaxID=3068 RepID=D8UHJ9_VOLCA|nr:uncharacterized protein VOLCADRAFT_121683 [Volvox carteri f. nagariensis]EFJ40786.1 hypothetical protein VOLCADRAFT_121683 [Volvox carteri f. nagariensis]|eukprot:XP_002958161.1 hypothetical protein VOLCADRAFT_121683 [Volvox carteri f. nagariensis]
MATLTGTSGCAWRQCLPSVTRPLALRRTVRCRAAYQTEAGMPPQPPPPPPPPGPGSFTRRSLLQRFGGFGAAAAVGGVVGFLAGSRSGGGESDELRRELHFRRDYDGHVFVRDGRGSWWEVRLDAKLPGTLLLRDPRDGVYFITYNNIQQIDLTDDYVVGSLFAGGDWEAIAQRVQARDDAGALVDVKMPKDAFRDMISVMD